ncbi:MAG: response regulator [Bacteroidota bacterium]
MKRLADWSLEYFRKADQLSIRLKAEVIYRFSIMFVCMVSAILCLSLVLPSPGASRITLAISLGLFFLPIILLRFSNSTQPAALTFLGTLFVSLSIYVVASGFPTHPTISVWFVSLVISTDLLLSRKWSIWLTLAILGVFVLATISFQADWGVAEAIRSDIIVDVWFTNVLFGMNLWAVLHILKQHHLVHQELQNDAQAQNQQVSRLLEEQQNLNKELQESNFQAKQAVVAKSQFLSTMSHEIRTPMNAVIGMTSLLQQTHLSKEQKGLVETVRLSGENLLSIINDILDFSKIEAGKLELEIHPFSVAQALEDALDLLSGKATEKGLELMYYIDKEVPQAVASDLTRLRQVLINLTNNAIKFTEEGEILVWVSSKGATNGRQVLVFEVRDSGIGISQEAQNRLFRSFSQVDATTTRKYGGTGLGLAISRRLVELMGGEIWVKSEPGKGSSFFFTIRAPEVKDDAELCPPSTIGSGQKILIVDDNQTNREILQKQCLNWGYTPILAGNTEIAEQILITQDDIQLVILDYQMPEKNGLSFAKELRQIQSLSALPILMLTSLGMTLSMDNRKYINEYIHKPVKATQLRVKLSNLLSPETSIPSSPPAPTTEKSNLFEHKDTAILIVEDNIVNQKVALKMLKKIGLTADVVGDGQQAVFALERGSYDLILMDMQMPIMDGITATKVIRKRKKEFGEPTIIAMTANAFSTDREACFEAGMNDFLSKPVRLKDLKDKLIYWIEQGGKKEGGDLSFKGDKRR